MLLMLNPIQSSHQSPGWNECNESYSIDHMYLPFSALLLLYDVTSKTSFDNIRAWLVEIKEYAQEDVVIMLLGEFDS